jgi:hypothetical protein
MLATLAGMSVTKLLTEAKRAIAAGESHLRKAAELIVKARTAGATQRQIAERVGKSQSWISQLLAWRKSGYKGGAFERSHKARTISRANQSRATSHRPMTTEEAEAMRARAVAVAAMFGAESKRIPAAARKEFLTALAMLAKSRDTAAVLVERQRARLNLTWDDLLVPAEHENESPLRVATAA